MQRQKIVSLLIILILVAFIVPQITLAAWWNPFSWGVWNRIFHKQIIQVACTKEAKLCPDGSTTVGRQGPKCEFAECPKLIGGDKDEHGCIGSAGYSWCEIKQKCLRVWEEKCETDQTVGWKTYKNTHYGFEMRYPLDWKIGDNPTNVSLEDTKNKIGNINIGGVVYFKLDAPLEEALTYFGFKKEDEKYFVNNYLGSWINAQEKNINGNQVIIGDIIINLRDGDKITKKEGKRFLFIGKNSYAVLETPFYKEYNVVFDQLMSTFKFINPVINSQTFRSEQECEEKTGCVCSFVMCDYVPEGKTFEEVCGEDFQKGWECVK